MKRFVPSRTVAVLVTLVLSAVAPGLLAAPSPPTPLPTTLVVALRGEPAGLNSLLTDQVFAQIVASQILEGLLKYNLDNKPVLNLAKSFEYDSTATRLTVQLHSGVKWHDGRPFTADDVRFTIVEAMPRSPFRGLFASVQSVDVVNPETIVIRLAEPNAGLLDALAYTPIVPAHLLRGRDILRDEFNRAPVGTGPFKFAQWVTGSYITVVRNPDYWREGLPYLQEVVFRIIPDIQGQISSLENREIDYIPRWVPVDEHRRLNTTAQFFKSVPYTYASMNGPAVQMNLKAQSPVSNISVRRAIAHAINKEQVNRLAYAGLGRIKVGPTDYFAPMRELYPFDPDLSREILDRAGYPVRREWIRFTLKLRIQADLPDYNLSGKMIAQHLRLVGIQTQILETNQVDFIARVFDQFDFDLAMYSPALGPDPSRVASAYGCKAIRAGPFTNANQLCDPVIEGLIAKVSSVTNLAQRRDVVAQLNRRIMEHVPTVFINYAPQFGAFNAGLQGLPAGASLRDAYTEVRWVRPR